MRAFLLLFLLGLGLPIGCGRVDFALAGMERVGDAPTAGDDGAGPDGAVAGCTGAFADPVLIPELVSGQSEATFRLTADELTGVLWSTRGGVIDLYLAERPDRATPFALSALTTLNSTANEFDPSIAADGSLIVFASGRPGGDGGLDLYESIVNNNSHWAAVKRATLQVYPGGHASKVKIPPMSGLDPSPAFEKYVEASGGHGERVETPADLLPAMKRALDVVRNERRQAVLNVLCD